MVMKREILRKLEDSGLFLDLIKCGVISANIRTYSRWCDRYDELRRLGSGKMDAYNLIAEENGVCESVVRQRIKEMCQ